MVQGGLGQAPEGGAGTAGLEDGAEAEQPQPGQQEGLLALRLQRHGLLTTYTLSSHYYIEIKT